MTTETKPGIYVHVPFCVRKCNYCAFLSAPASEETREDYVEALIRELSSYNDEREFDTVYFGGGTPTLLSPKQIGRILDCIRANYQLAVDSELTLEANPGTLGSTDAEVRERLSAYRRLGINRLSMGVQSMNDDRLKFLGRIHSTRDVERDYWIARECGFANINLDLITAVPGMTLGDALSDIKEVAALGPEHISMYTLQLEEGTPFHKAWERGEFEIVDDELDRRMYHEGARLLETLGYERYEISNFARGGRMSRHNSKYWNMTDYVGAGLGASGFLNGVRYMNTTSMDEYLAGRWRAEEHANTEHDRISEAVFTGLRRREGIVFDEICPDFRTYYAGEWNELMNFVNDGYVELTDDGMRLTERGIDISNTIMAIFV